MASNDQPAASSSGREVSGEGHMISRPDSPAAIERAALGRIRDSLNARIFRYREEREEHERALENLARFERSALEEVAAIDAALDLTNPYRKAVAS